MMQLMLKMKLQLQVIIHFVHHYFYAITSKINKRGLK